MNRRDAIAALISLPAVARISSAKIKPDDIIVVECDQAISQDAARKIKETITQIWPNQKCVVMSDGLRLKIVGAAEEPT